MSAYQIPGEQFTGAGALAEQECLRLLGSIPVGRVAFTSDALPSVQPVPFVLRERQVVFRTNLGSRLEAALHGAIVAFEADDFDEASGTGWSVTVVGPAVVVTATDAESEPAEPLAPSATGGGDRLVTISIKIVNGRRIGVTPGGEVTPGSDDTPGYSHSTAG